MNLERKLTYLDYSASTPVDALVYDEMKPFFMDFYGNPSSTHRLGQKSEIAIESARNSISSIFKCNPDEIIFTSGGSESNNLALRGIANAQKSTYGKNHILISPVEHDSISQTALQLQEHFGFEMEFLPINQFGQVDPRDVEMLIKPNTALVSVIYANNEIGSINNIRDIGAICQEKQVFFHTDAVQAASYLPLDVTTLNVDALSIGAHKFYGPKGVGALFLKSGTPFISNITGGKQENGFRAGTSNVPYIVGQAKALEIANIHQREWIDKLSTFRDYLIANILESIPDTKITGHTTERLPNHASFIFKNVDGNELVMQLDNLGFACSSGSACKTGNPKPSEVLSALKINPDWILGSLRLSLGQFTTKNDISRLLEHLPEVIKINRKLFGVSV